MSTIVFHDWHNLIHRCAFLPDVAIKDFRKQHEIDDGVPREEPNYDLWFQIIFNNIYYSIPKNQPLKEIILASDARQSWRKFYWSRYKESRKLKKDTSVNWEEMYDQISKFEIVLQKYLPFKYIKADNCEGDDVIGVLALALEKKYDCMIISTDNDYKQLCAKDKNIKLYNPHPFVKKTFENIDTEKFLTEACIKGQKKDDIFNIHTGEKWDATTRRPALGEKKLKSIIREGLDVYLKREGIEHRYKRNQILVDLTKQPEVIKKRIYKEYKRVSNDHPTTGLDAFFEAMGWGLHRWEKVDEYILPLYSKGWM